MGLVGGRVPACDIDASQVVEESPGVKHDGQAIDIAAVIQRVLACSRDHILNNAFQVFHETTAETGGGPHQYVNTHVVQFLEGNREFIIPEHFIAPQVDTFVKSDLVALVAVQVPVDTAIGVVDDEVAIRRKIMILVGCFAYLIGIGISFISPVASLCIYGLAAFLSIIITWKDSHGFLSKLFVRK